MKKYCVNHPTSKAVSFCHGCGDDLCTECLVAGTEYYYCRKDECQSLLQEELKNFAEGYDTNPRFCPKCMEETLPESCGDVQSINFTGERLSNLGHECPVCHSIIAEEQNVFLGLPGKSHEYYRIIYLKDGVNLVFVKDKPFLSRRLKNQTITPQNT